MKKTCQFDSRDESSSRPNKYHPHWGVKLTH